MMRTHKLVGRIPVGVLIAVTTAGAAAVFLCSHTVIRAQPGAGGSEMGGGSGMGGPGMGGPGMGGPGMGGPGMGGPGMGGPGMGGAGGESGSGGGGGGSGSGGQIEDGMVAFPNVPGITGLVDTGTFYKFSYTDSDPGGSETIRVEIPKELEGTPLTEQRHFDDMWGQIFRVFEAGSSQRAGELTEERDARTEGARAGSKMMIARSGDEEITRRDRFDGPLPEEQLAIQRGLEAGSSLAAERIRGQE